jgi:hypothetical protein
MILGFMIGLIVEPTHRLISGLVMGLGSGLLFGLIEGVVGGLKVQQVDQITYPGQRLVFTAKNFLFSILLVGLSVGLIIGLFFSSHDDL